MLEDYLFLISVLLTTATVVLAGVAIGIGIVATFTFRDIRNKAETTARKIAHEAVEKALSEDDIQDRVAKVAFETQGQGRISELEETDPSGREER